MALGCWRSGRRGSFREERGSRRQGKEEPGQHRLLEGGDVLRLSSYEAQLKQSQVGSGLGVSGLGGKELQGCRPSTQKALKKHLQNKTDLHLPPHYTLAQMQEQKQRSCHWVQAGGGGEK